MNNKLLLCMGPTRTGTTYLWRNLKQVYNSHPVKETYSWSPVTWDQYVVMHDNKPLKMTRDDLEELIVASNRPFMEMSPSWHELLRDHENIKYMINNFDTSFIVCYRDPILAVQSVLNNFYNILASKKHTQPIATEFKNRFSNLTATSFQEMVKRMKPFRNETMLFKQYKYSTWIPILESLTNKIIYLDYNKLGNSQYLNKKFGTDFQWDNIKYNTSNKEIVDISNFDSALLDQLRSFYQEDYEYIYSTFDKYM